MIGKMLTFNECERKQSGHKMPYTYYCNYVENIRKVKKEKEISIFLRWKSCYLIIMLLISK